jgi:hypothetical protein
MKHGKKRKKNYRKINMSVFESFIAYCLGVKSLLYKEK